jgi:hypothetical protein
MGDMSGGLKWWRLGDEFYYALVTDGYCYDQRTGQSRASRM